ncbi:MAG: hypothetical protein CME06_10805 [Gemmatimonadetes bacterium]|nr:hypothetical protein [Gemmatimonadota bacterium]
MRLQLSTLPIRFEKKRPSPPSPPGGGKPCSTLPLGDPDLPARCPFVAFEIPTRDGEARVVVRRNAATGSKIHSNPLRRVEPAIRDRRLLADAETTMRGQGPFSALPASSS